MKHKPNFPAIKISNVDFCYSDNSDYILKDFSLTINHGEYISLLGHNGSGKSTISKIIAGLIEPKKGEVLINNLVYNEQNKNQIRRNLGIIFQNPDAQFVGVTVEDDIAFVLENHNFDPQVMKSIIAKQLDLVKMGDFINYKPHNLSGGQKQKIAIAGVLAIAPNIIIFDEATSMLDPQGVEEINQIINELHQQKNITIINITHNMEEVINTQRLIVLEKGSIKFDGKPQDILFNEKQIKSLQLQAPFAVKLCHGLNKAKLFNKKVFNIKEIVACL